MFDDNYLKYTHFGEKINKIGCTYPKLQRKQWKIVKILKENSRKSEN